MKIAFCKILSQFASGFMLDLGGVVGYIDEIQHKIRCKMGRKIVGMNFQTRSRPQETIDISADAKSVRLDIYVEDGEETVYNIEMQATANRNLPKRTRYYQGMIDLNILEKGKDYKGLKCSFVIFVCAFDLFGEGRHIYTFENRCIQNLGLGLGDGTAKIILNTKGTMDDVTPELKRLLDFIDGKEPEDDFTRELDAAVQSARRNEKWRVLDIQWMSAKHRPEQSGEGLYDVADALSGKI